MTYSQLITDYIGHGTHAARPTTPNVAAGVAAVYDETDTGNTFVWSGSAWVQVNGSGSSSSDMIRAYANATAQSIAPSTLTTVQFDTNDASFSTNTAMHSTSSNTTRLVAQAAGRYEIKGCIGFAANATGVRQASVQVNGTTSIAHNTVNTIAGWGLYVPVSTEWYLNAGDYAEVVGYQASGGALGVSQGADATWVTMRRVG